LPYTTVKMTVRLLFKGHEMSMKKIADVPYRRRRLYARRSRVAVGAA
jgi:hypothetical protein